MFLRCRMPTIFQFQLPIAVSISITQVQPDGNIWSRVPGRTYREEFSDDLIIKKIMIGSSENCCSGKLNTLSGFVPSTSLMPSNFVSQNRSKHVHGVYAFGLFPHPKNTKIKVHLASKATEHWQSIKYLMTVRGCG